MEQLTTIQLQSWSCLTSKSSENVYEDKVWLKVAHL